MTLDVRSRGKGRVLISLVSCPACGHPFAPNEDRDEHIAAHDPEDFGLSPLGETPESALAPLFGGEEF